MAQKPKAIIFTYTPSPYQVELFDEASSDPDWDFEVVYIHRREGHRKWAHPDIRHSHRFLSEEPAELASLRADCAEADLVVFNYYRHPVVHQLLQERARSGQPWCFWGERPGVKLKGPLGPLYRRWKLRSLHRSTASIWGIGQWAAAAYREEFGARHATHNLPYFSDLRRFKSDRQAPGFEKEERILLYSGVLDSRKGVDLLATAFAKAADEFPNLRLLVLGYGELEDEMGKALAHLHDRVEFAGFVDWEELPEAYHRADAMVVPSRYDGWAIVVPEGLSAGLPVIGTDRTGAALQLIEDGRNGWLIPADDADSLYEAIAKFARLPSADLARFSKAASDSVANHQLSDGAATLKSLALAAIDEFSGARPNQDLP